MDGPILEALQRDVPHSNAVRLALERARQDSGQPPPVALVLAEHAGTLRLHGLQAHWAEVMGEPQQARWVAQMLSWKAAERGRRSLERRQRAAHIGPSSRWRTSTGPGRAASTAPRCRN